MKTLFKYLSFLAVLAFFFAPGLVRAQDDSDDQGVSFQTFYDQLGDQGTWVQTDDYGYVFQPNVQDPDWAPYTDGHWVYTDEGWTWVSDEPWGWATYHYGRWINIDGEGWVWVPGYRWAPAWVSWRYGGGYVGWAPLPPESFVGAEYGEPGGGGFFGFHFGNDVDVNFHIGAGCYNFVRVEDIGERDYHHRFVNRENNFAIINRTTNITNINVNSNGGNAANFRSVAAGGPPINEINARSRQHVQTVQLTAAAQPGRSTVQGNSLAVFAPKVNPASTTQARPASVAQTISHPTFNRGDSITRPLAVTASVKPAPPTQATIQAAATAQSNAPASAKIATAKTPIRTTFSKPLTSLAPVTLAPRTTTPAATGASVVHPNNASPGEVNPNVEHNAANTPFTGESVKPAVTQPNEVKPANNEVSNQEQQQAQAQQEEKAQQQAQQEARQQQAAQAQQEARQQQAAQAQQEEKTQQQQAQQEARQQQAAQAQQEEKAQQQQQAQQEARQQQAAQAQQEEKAQQQQAQQEARQQQVQQQASHQEQAPAAQPKSQAQATQPKPQGSNQSENKSGGGNDNKKPDNNKPSGQ